MNNEIIINELKQILNLCKFYNLKDVKIVKYKFIDKEYLQISYKDEDDYVRSLRLPAFDIYSKFIILDDEIFYSIEEIENMIIKLNCKHYNVDSKCEELGCKGCEYHVGN